MKKYHLLDVAILNEAPLGPGVLLLMWTIESHTFAATWESSPLPLEDVERLTMLPLYGSVNALGIVLEEDGQVKLKYITASLAAGRMSTKSTYAT